MSTGDIALSERPLPNGGGRLGIVLPVALLLAIILAALSPAPVRAMVVSTVLLLLGFGAAIATYLRNPQSGARNWDRPALLVFTGFAAALVADHDHWLR